MIVVNDNGRSYAPTIGGLAHHLDTLRTTQGYENVLSWGKRTLRRSGAPGRATYDALHGMKKGIKDVLVPQGMFEDLGIKYVGPVDGHDVPRGRAGAAQREGVRRSGDRARHHREGPRLRPGRAGRRRPVPRRRQDPPRDRPAGRAVAVRVDQRVRRRARADRPSPPGRRRHHRRDAPARRPRAVRRRVPRRACSTSASPSSTPRRPPPAWRSAACTPSSPCTRRSSTARSTRCSWTWRCTRPASRSCSTAPGSRAPTARATTACGTWRCSASCPGLRLAAPRDEETLRDALRTAVDVDDAPTVVRYPKGALVDPSRRSTTSTASTSSPGTTVPPTRRTCSSSGTARWRRQRSRRAELLAAHGLRVDRRRPAVGPAGLRGAHQAGRGPRPRRHHRGRRRRRWPRLARRPSGPARRASGRRCRPSASRARSSTTPPASSWSTELRLRPADIARDTLAALGRDPPDPREGLTARDSGRRPPP